MAAQPAETDNSTLLKMMQDMQTRMQAALDAQKAETEKKEAALQAALAEQKAETEKKLAEQKAKSDAEVKELKDELAAAVQKPEVEPVPVRYSVLSLSSF